MQIVWFSRMMRVESFCRKSRATVSDTGMDTSHFAAGLVPILGTALLLGETPLRFGQVRFSSWAKKRGLPTFSPAVQHHHIMQAQINAHLRQSTGGNGAISSSTRMLTK